MSTNLWTKVNTLSFKTKATALAIAVGMIPVVATGTVNYLQVRNASLQQTASIQKARAAAVADKLNRFIFERYGDVSVLSALPIFTNAKVAAINTIAEKNLLLDRFANIYQVYDSIAAFDAKGQMIAQSKSESLAKNNHLNRQYFQEVLKTGKAVISTPELDKYTGKVSVFFAAPIRDKITNQIIGVIRTRTPVDRLAAPLKEFDTNIEHYHILDRQTNQVFISSNQQYRNQPASADMVKARITKSIVNHKQTGDNDKAALLSIAPFTKLDGMPELPWEAVVTIDEAAAYLELQGLLLTILGGAGLMAFGTVGLSTFFIDRTAKYVQRTILTISLSADEIIDTVQSQEIAINQQANVALSTTDTMNQLGDISDETAAQAAASATGAQQALALTDEGTQVVQQTLTGMSELRVRVDEIADQIVNLGEQTGQISTVSNLVSELAKQTNMLALKAAVEAARVGEQGKGFGVVAGEIRKLAEESKKSAEKIDRLAADIQAAINRTVMVTDRGTKTVTEGIQLAENTAATFIGVTNAVNTMFLSSQQISVSAKQQAVSIQEVLASMNLVSQGSQESAIGMHRVKTSTRELTQIADDLQAVVS